MRVAFFGLPLAALLLARDGHDVVYAAICRANAPGTRRLRRRIGDDRVVVKPRVDTKKLQRHLDDLAPDLIVSWFWTTKVPDSIVATARLGGFGVHPSLLPRWRGPDPYFWAIDAGDVETGVTAHRLATDYDTGAILGATTLRIDPRWDSWMLARALDRPSLALVRSLCRRFGEGESIVERAQDESRVTLAPAPTDEILEIDWKSPRDAILRRIRAAAPYPGAWTFLGDEALVVTRASEAVAPKGLEPGEAAIVDGAVVVVASDGAVALRAGRRILDDDREVFVDAAAIVDLLRLPSNE